METEEEEDWVVQALQDEKATKASEDETPTDHNNGECSDATSRVQSSVSFKGSSDGASAVSVGFDFTIGGGKKNGRKDSVLVAAAAGRVRASLPREFLDQLRNGEHTITQHAKK